MNRKRIGIILVIMAVIVGGIVGYYHERPETNGSINASNDQKKKLEQQQDEKCKELVQQKGRYDEKTIVLSDTNESRAKALADKMGASVRMTADKHFAVLTLPKDVKVEDIYSNKEYRQDLSDMSLNYHVKASAVDASQHELYQTRADYEVSDPDYDKQSETGYLNLRDTWKHNKGAGVTVAIIDTGIDTDHEEFQGRISKLSYNASGDKIVKDYDMSVIEDEQGHGTSVAGTLGASMNNGSGITGVAPETELLVIKCDADAQGNFLRASDLVFGLAYAIEADADVVNMSFVTDENIFSYYTKLAADSDVICVAAAGNDSTALLNYPAADENVIGVGALDSDWELAAYSNYGDNSDIVAPGSVYTTKMGGTYGYTQGTSLASPIVAAAAALYRADHPGAEFKEIRDYLIASSVDLGTSGEDVLYGYGALDIYAFLYEEKGTITYEMQTDEIKNQTQPFVKGHTVQLMLEPEREDVVFDGWYYDRDCTDEVEYYTDVFSQDVTLYAKWVNEDDANAYTYTTEWISSDESVATVSENGEVTAAAPGETDIRIRHGSIDEAHYTVRVYAPLQSIAFKETIEQMNVGDEKKLQITYDPVNTSDDKSVTWISTDRSVLSVNADGTVTAKGPGHAKIIALVNGRGCEMEVEVFAPLQWIKLNTATGTLRLERKKELSVIYEPENTTDDTTVQWESSDPSIATVDENGVVTAVQTGKATITATVGDKTASYEVTVVGLKDDKTGIIVSNSDDSEMDKDMTLGVDEITKEVLQKKYPKGWELFWKIIQEMIKAAKGHKPVTPIFDISLYENEAAVQPGQSVDVEIPVPDGVLTEDAVIYRIEEDGTITDMHAKYQNGKFTFQTEHFSVYALGTKSEQIYTTDITLDQDELALCPGKTATLSAIAAPENITKPGINWKSSDESVAIVSEDGVISAVAAGTATISAIAADNEEVTAQCLVTVGHSYGEPIVIKYANCSETGKAVEVCGGCGESREIILPIDSDAHVWGEEYVIDREASEDEEGQKSIHCTLCDAINPESIIMIPKVTPAPTETPVPTIEPTETPTVKPSETPVPMETPTVKPGESPKPTEKPSETLVPTIEPTEIPTVKPSESPKPTETPVPIETVTPTAKPSESTVPTVTPTVKPGETPQPTEAVTPTAKPSETPAPTGTVTPTAKPSETPVPTEPVIPTVKPSETPKPTETVTPTVKPSETPAPIPTQPAAPDGTSQPLPSLDQGMVSPDPSHGDTVSVGTVLVKDGVTYRITADDTVEYQKADAKAKGTVVIPATVTLQGTTYKVTSIAAKAFYNNKKLKKIVIGKNVVQIGKKAFYGCSNLKNIVIKTKELTAKTVGKKAFYKVHKKAVVKVPKKCKKQYKIWLKKTGITGQRKIR